METIEAYFKSLSKSRLLSAEEERDLAVRIRAGDDQARHALIDANLRLVIRYASRLARMHRADFMELIAVGNLALTRIVDRYDPDWRTSFAGFACRRLRGPMQHALAKDRKVKVPLVSLSEPLGDDLTLEDTLPAETSEYPHRELDLPVIRRIARQLLQAPLTRNERRVACLFFGFDRREPLSEIKIAKRMKLTRCRINQLKRAALRKMRTLETQMEVSRANI